MGRKYTPEKIFNTVMDFIDEEIMAQATNSEITKNMVEETGITTTDFNKILKNLNYPYMSLALYISARRANLAIRYLLDNPNKSIQYVSDIFGYSEASAFSRDIRKKYKFSPTEARHNHITVPDNKMSFLSSEEKVYAEKPADAPEPTKSSEKENDNMNDDIYAEMAEQRAEYLLDIMWDVNETRDYPLDMGTIEIICDLADRFDLPANMFCHDFSEKLFDLFTSDMEFERPSLETCKRLNIEKEEMKKICKLFGCKHYELTQGVVELYHNIEDYL